MTDETPRQTLPTLLVVIGSLAAGVLAGVLLSQEAGGINGAYAPAGDTNARLVSLENSYKGIRKDFDEFEKQTLKIQSQNMPRRSIKLDVTSQSYDWIETDLGVLMVIVENVQPYADGQRITMRIGNPHNAAFVGFKGSFAYGKLGNFQTKDQDFTTTLNAGAWTNVSAILPKLPADQLDSIYMALDINQISLRR
jgi:hypothetical protein